MGSSPVAVTHTLDIAPVSSKELLDIQATIKYGLTLRRVRDIIRTYSQALKDVVKKFLELYIFIILTFGMSSNKPNVSQGRY